MMTDRAMDSNASPPASSWSNRIFVLATAGILFLTLYPFRFVFDRHLPGEISPFLLGGQGKAAGLFDVFLNVLLFVPYGFGLAAKLRRRGKSRIATLAFAFAAGLLLSYIVEFLQIYIPSRDSGWLDLITNTSGSIVGALLFQLVGVPLLLLLSSGERFLQAWMSWSRAAVVLLLYFGLWFAFSASLQKQTRFSNWNSDSLLRLGGSTLDGLAPAWKGRIWRLEVWDRALPAAVAQNLTAEGPSGPADPSSLADFDFSGPSPFQDRRHFLPALSRSPDDATPSVSDGAVLGGRSGLTSVASISGLVQDLRKTRQFALRIVCQPAEVQGVNASVLSLSPDSRRSELELRQKDSGLVFWFRTPVSINRPRMSWTIPDVLSAKKPSDILFSYDGSKLSLFVDGKQQPSTYQLGPGTALARTIRRIKAAELAGYHYIFYALVFFPAGCVLGIAWRKMTARPIERLALVLLGALVPSALFELFLVHLSGRMLSSANIMLSVVLALAGSFWINLDRAALDPAHRSNERTVVS